jgi:hypothetical protein
VIAPAVDAEIGDPEVVGQDEDDVRQGLCSTPRRERDNGRPQDGE